VAAIRFYVDADLLALGKSLAAARYDVSYPGDPGDTRRGRPACTITSPTVKDPVWIPQVAARGWVVISRDARIARKRIELAAIKSSALRVVVLDTRQDPTTWHELRIVAAQWDNIETLVSTPGPCVFSATRSSFRPVELG
jgi:hypothetical protein